ncbi:hypothetical protein H2202_006114 [Exophiala xenobiotica]|nr:hypothetical protein H2202_006114 [Exophiala xenobiotica]
MHYFQSVHLYQTSPSYTPQHLHTQVATYATDNPYYVNGKKVVGDKPNYHDVRPKATDLVPGLLSMDYIYNIYERGGKQAAFDSRAGVVVGGDRFLENLQADSS